MPFKPFSRKQRTHSSRPSTSDDQPPAHGATIVSDPAWIDTHDDVAMNAIQTSLAVLKEGSSLAAKFPFIAPIAGLLLQALTMRDEVKQYKQECEIVMYKLARIAKIIVNVCEKYNLSEEELPATLRDILGSLQRELDRIGRVLEKCSKRKGLKGILLRKDLLTKIKQCDVELSNVLQAFQTELGLDIRFALVVQRRGCGNRSTLISAQLKQPRLFLKNQMLHRYFGVSWTKSQLSVLAILGRLQTGPTQLSAPFGRRFFFEP
ncbi:hypothetical protein EDB85DRAFT_140150 [Lactarius pseudohatsudake]|nr:hypothetical protein EDB85DRAFT_140150 [Lactarius pseudohatsudake]